MSQVHTYILKKFHVLVTFSKLYSKLKMYIIKTLSSQEEFYNIIRVRYPTWNLIFNYVDKYNLLNYIHIITKN